MCWSEYCVHDHIVHASSFVHLIKRRESMLVRYFYGIVFNTVCDGSNADRHVHRGFDSASPSDCMTGVLLDSLCQRASHTHGTQRDHVANLLRRYVLADDVLTRHRRRGGHAAAARGCLFYLATYQPCSSISISITVASHALQSIEGVLLYDR